MSKSKYTNTANAGRLRRRGQSVPKNLLTSEDRFIDGTYKKKLTETLKALAIRNGFANAFSVPTLFLLAYPGLRQPWAGISERLRRFGLHSNWTSTFALKLDQYLCTQIGPVPFHSNWTSAFSLKLDQCLFTQTGPGVLSDNGSNASTSGWRRPRCWSDRRLPNVRRRWGRRLMAPSYSTSADRFRVARDDAQCAARVARRSIFFRARRRRMQQLRATSLHSALPETVSVCNTSFAGTSGKPKNSPKNRRSDKSSCSIIWPTLLERGCGLKARSSSANSHQTEFSLFTSLA